MVGRNRLHLGLVEFLNEGKDETGVTLQFLHQIITAAGDKLAGFGFAQQAAVFKGAADLLVQFFPVGEDDNSGRTCKFPPNLLRKKNHGVTLATALGVPEYTQLAIFEFSGFVGVYRFVNAQILVITGENLSSTSAGMVIKDEVFQQIKKILFFADAPQHGLQRHAALILFV